MNPKQALFLFLLFGATSCGSGGGAGSPGTVTPPGELDGAWVGALGLLHTVGEDVDLEVNGTVFQSSFVADTQALPVHAYQLTAANPDVDSVEFTLAVGVEAGPAMGVGQIAFSGLYYLPIQDVSVEFECGGQLVAADRMELTFHAQCYDGYQIVEVQDPATQSFFYEIATSAIRVSESDGALVLQRQ